MGNFLNNLNEKLNNFMVGRNGSDKLARWSLGIAIVLACVNIFLPNIICSILSYALLFYCIFRMFSKNITARQEENEKFENLFNRNGNRNKNSNRSNTAKKSTSSTIYFKCDECGQSLSVPKGKGTLKVTCPKCKHQTTIRS